MAWLHTWTGLLLGWLLFAIFVTGTSDYFQEEITRWMTPEVRSVPADPASGFVAATEWLKREATDGSEWSLYSQGQRHGGLQLYSVNCPDDLGSPPCGERLCTSG